MMIGIQSLMKQNKNHQLFWDFSHLSIEELEDIVIENEVFLIQRARATKSGNQIRNSTLSEERKQNKSKERFEQNQGIKDQAQKVVENTFQIKQIERPQSKRRQAPFYTDENETAGTAEIARKSLVPLIKQEIEPKKSIKKVTVVESDSNKEIKTILKPSKNQQQDFSSITPQVSMEHHNQLIQEVEQALQVKNELDNFLKNEKAAQTTDSLIQEIKYTPIVNSKIGPIGAHQVKTQPNVSQQQKVPLAYEKSKNQNSTQRQAGQSQGRHQPVFNKHKSSSAMNLLLKADEALTQKQNHVAQVLKNQRQPSQRKDITLNQRQGIHQIATKIGQEKFVPSSARQIIKIENLMEQKQEIEQQRKASRSPSYGRPSSKWRTGMTQEEISKTEEESVRNGQEKKQQNIKYPKWWQNYQPSKEELEKEERKGQAKRSRSPEQQAIQRTVVQDPARAKVHKTLGRYAEDSLDARLRQVHQNVQNNSIEQALQWQTDLQNNNNYNTINMSGIMPPGAPIVDIISGETAIGKGKQKRVLDDNFNHHENLKNSNFLYHSNTTSLPSLQGSSTGLHGYQNGLINSSNKQKNILDSAYGQGPDNKAAYLQMQNLPQPIVKTQMNHFENQNQQNQGQSGSHLSKTQGSLSSFAYTSGKGFPKYSPARAPNPGSSNIPMSYAGPPTTQEMQRDAMRHASGNRNFSQTVSHDELPFGQTLPKKNPHAPKFSFDGSAVTSPYYNQGSKEKPYHNQEGKNSLNGSKTQLQNNQNAHLIYLEQQKEAERNRKRVQQSLNNDVPEQVPAGNFSGRGAYGVVNADLINEESHSSPSPDNQRHIHDSAERNNSQDEGNMRRYAKGGMAITINLTGSQSREEIRSNSKPRYPFMDQEPFQGNEVPNRQRNSQKKLENQGKSDGVRYKSKQFQQVGSTIKQIIDQDKRIFQERQLLQTNQDSQQNSTLVEENSVSAQIFYKKNNSKVEYQDGVDDSYRNPYYEQQLPRFRMNNEYINNVQKGQITDGYYQQENLMQEQNRYKRTYQDLGPQSEIENSNMIEVQLRQGGKPSHGVYSNQWIQNQIHSDIHNETAFSKKLMMGNQTQQTILQGQNRINGSQAYDAYNHVGSGGHGNYLPDSSFKEQSSQQDDENSYGYRGEGPVPPHFSNGFYDERGNYHYTNQQQYANSQGRGIAQWQDQIRISEPREARRGREDENLSESKNNTSRFAFQSQDEGVQSNHNLQHHHDDLPLAGQYIPQTMDGGRSGRFGQPGSRPWHGGQEINSYREPDDQSSLITPNASQGARGKLQNQLEQVLMMRSGDFSAGGVRDNDGLLRSVGGSIANVGEHSEVLDDGRYYQQHSNLVNGNQDNNARAYQSLTSAPANKNNKVNLGYQPSSEGRNYGNQALNSNNFNTSQFANVIPNELESADRYDYNQGLSVSQEDYQRQMARLDVQYQQQQNQGHQVQKPVQNLQHNGNNFTLRKTSEADHNTDFRTSQGKRITSDQQPNYYVENDRDIAVNRQSQASLKSHLQQNQQQNFQIPQQSPHSQQQNNPTHHRIGSGKSNRNNNYVEVKDPKIQKQKIPNYQNQQKQTQNYATFNEGNLPEDVIRNYRNNGIQQNFQENDHGQMLPSELEVLEQSHKSRTDPNSLRRDGTYEVHQFLGSQIGGESELDTNIKTEHLRQFMEQAQPADGLMQSQITSGLGQESMKLGSRNNQMISEGMPSIEQHKIKTPLMAKSSSHLQPSSRTHENEGGSVDDPAYAFLRGGPIQGNNSFRGNNNYAGLNHENMNYDEDRVYRDITDESSPQISNTEHESPDHQNYPNDGQTYDDDYISSSFQETPQNQDLLESSGIKQGKGQVIDSSNKISGRSQEQLQGQDYHQNIQRMTQQAERLVDQLAYMRNGQNYKQSRGRDSQRSQQNEEESSLSPLRDSDL